MENEYYADFKSAARDFGRRVKKTASDYYSNTKNAIKPNKVKSGSVEGKKVRITKYKNYDKKTVTYKIVTYRPKRELD